MSRLWGEAEEGGLKFMEAFEGVQSALDGVSAAIMQVPERNMRLARSTALIVTGKAGGAVTAAAALNTAATIGVAKTGTAISSLSGAAAANAQLAWLGGGSMATGGIVLVGLAVAGGYGVNRLARATILGFPRAASELDVVEAGLVYAASQLNFAIPGDGRVGSAELRVFCRDGLWPLVADIDAHGPAINRNLKPVPRLKLRQHWHELAYFAAVLDPDGIARTGLREADCGPWFMAMLQQSDDGFLEYLRKEAEESKLKSAKVRAAQLRQVTDRAADAGLDAVNRGRAALGNWRSENVGRLKADGSGPTLAARGIQAADTVAPFAKAVSDRAAFVGAKVAAGGAKAFAKAAKTVDGGVGRMSDRLQKPRHRTSILIAVVMQRLLRDAYADLTWEEDLVVQALRRSVPALADADRAEVAAYLRGLSGEQLRGVLSSTKGIYHEMLFVELHNAGCETGCEARLMEMSNHPGTDVEFVLDGEVVRAVQLKAVATPAQVNMHLETYPGIDVVATEEVVKMMDGVESSNLSNADLEAETTARLLELEGESVLDNVTDALATSAMVNAAQMTRLVLKGGRPILVRDALSDGVAAIAASTLMDAVLAADAP